MSEGFDSVYDNSTEAGEWSHIPYSAAPTRVVPDSTSKSLADLALSVLSPAERLVIEHAYGFRGVPKSDAETAAVVGSTKGTVKSQRQRAMEKMRRALGVTLPAEDLDDVLDGVEKTLADQV